MLFWMPACLRTPTPRSPVVRAFVSLPTQAPVHKTVHARALPTNSPTSHVCPRAETATKTGMIMVFGEITTTATVDYEKVIRNTIQGIGYDDVEKGAFLPC